MKKGTLLVHLFSATYTILIMMGCDLIQNPPTEGLAGRIFRLPGVQPTFGIGLVLGVIVGIGFMIHCLEKDSKARWEKFQRSLKTQD